MRWGRKNDESAASDDATQEHVPTAGDYAQMHTATHAANDDSDFDVEDNDEFDQSTVVGRERQALGGLKIGSAFFGWLTATGMAVLLTALVTAGGMAVAVARGNDADSGVVETIGVTEAIVLLAIFFVAYYCGGYVAGRMARFNGLRQGVAVWVWALIIAGAVAIAAVVGGDQYDIQAELNNYPRIPTTEADLSSNGAFAAAATAAVTLLGAILGGLAGMRFHRKVDRAGFDTESV